VLPIKAIFAPRLSSVKSMIIWIIVDRTLIISQLLVLALSSISPFGSKSPKPRL
jgi:hypothetical protein